MKVIGRKEEVVCVCLCVLVNVCIVKLLPYLAFGPITFTPAYIEAKDNLTLYILGLRITSRVILRSRKKESERVGGEIDSPEKIYY